MDTSETDEGNTTSSFDESSSVLSPGEIPGPLIEFDTATTGGLDFISSSGYPQIEFGYASGDDDSTEDDDDEDGDDEDEDDSKEGGDGTPSHSNGVINDKNKRVAGLALRRTRSDTRSQRSTKTILYIQ
jgi:translation initiation factor 2-alpha kinase 4